MNSRLFGQFLVGVVLLVLAGPPFSRAADFPADLDGLYSDDAPVKFFWNYEGIAFCVLPHLFNEG